MDSLIKLECMLVNYRSHLQRARRQARLDSEYGYLESSQFNLGQQFVLEYVIPELEALRVLLEVTGDE